MKYFCPWLLLISGYFSPLQAQDYQYPAESLSAQQWQQQLPQQGQPTPAENQTFHLPPVGNQHQHPNQHFQSEQPVPETLVSLSEVECESDCQFEYGGLLRSYYLNDQRLQWSGQEATFGVEGVFAGNWHHQSCDWLTEAAVELYLNQPFDKNLLADTPERRSYFANFDYDPIEISQLYLSVSREDFRFSLGKVVTPFGRAHFPVLTNERSDAPFIRTEAIRWRETGLLLEYTPGFWEFSVAFTNGIDERDTNSGKALIARAGLKFESFQCGISVKKQDGTGSENQKQFNNHAGVDFLWDLGNISFSGEYIYDEYGLRHPFNPLNITWKKSIYFRDIHKAVANPITGHGYYLNMNIHGDYSTIQLNYGEYYPEAIGVPQHDEVSRRGLIKYTRHASDRLDWYVAVIVENRVANAQAGRDRRGFYGVTGLQFTF